MLRILTDRGAEFCGRPDTHDYELFLILNDIDHTKTKAKHPQTNGIYERFNKTILEEFFSTAFRKKFTAHWRNCSMILMYGCGSTTMNVHIKGSVARTERPWKPSRRICPWQNKRY